MFSCWRTVMIRRVESTAISRLDSIAVIITSTMDVPMSRRRSSVGPLGLGALGLRHHS